MGPPSHPGRLSVLSTGRRHTFRTGGRPQVAVRISRAGGSGGKSRIHLVRHEPLNDHDRQHYERHGPRSSSDRLVAKIHGKPFEPAVDACARRWKFIHRELAARGIDPLPRVVFEIKLIRNVAHITLRASYPDRDRPALEFEQTVPEVTSPHAWHHATLLATGNLFGELDPRGPTLQKLYADRGLGRKHPMT